MVTLVAFGVGVYFAEDIKLYAALAWALIKSKI